MPHFISPKDLILPRKPARAALHPPESSKGKEVAQLRVRDLTSSKSSRKRSRTDSTTTEMFKVPFDLECDSCGTLITKGIKLNVRKKEVGSYYGKKAWSFKIKCGHCEHKIVLESSLFCPDYNIMAGARKVEVEVESGCGKIMIDAWEKKRGFTKGSHVGVMTPEKLKSFYESCALRRSLMR